MQAIILAAGRGTRMKKLTQKTNKPMLEIKGRPILDYKIRALPKKIKEVIFIVRYHCEDVMNYFGKEFDGRKIRYIFQDKLNGTGGAIHLARSFIKDKFLVMMGDDLYHKRDVNRILKHDLAVLAYSTDEAYRFGVLQTNRLNNLIRITEKPKNIKNGLVNTGLYVLNKKFFDYELVPIGDGEFGLPQTLAQMTDDYVVKVEETENWQPINKPEDLENAEEIIKKFL